MIDTRIGEGMLIIWHDTATDHETAIEHWYNAEHHFERLAIPGFLEARRYQCTDTDARRFMCLYRTKNPSVLTSEAYLTRVNNPTPWTRDVMPLYRNFSRTVCKTTHIGGRARGGWVAALALSLNPLSTNGLASSAITVAFENLLHTPGILRCQWLERASRNIPSTASVETKLCAEPDTQIDAAILVDANFQHQAYDALNKLEALLKKSAITYKLQQRGCYQQVFAASSSEL